MGTPRAKPPKAFRTKPLVVPEFGSDEAASGLTGEQLSQLIALAAWNI